MLVNYRLYIIFFIVTLIESCTSILTSDYSPNHFDLPPLNDIGIVNEVRVFPIDSSQLEVQVDFVIINGHLSQIEPDYNTALEKSMSNFGELPAFMLSFQNRGEDSLEFDLNFFRYNIAENQLQENLSIALLIDQSEVTNPIGYGFRAEDLEGITGLTRILRENDEILVASFPGNSSDPVRKLTDGFSRYSTDLQKRIADLPFQIGGERPTYESINNILDEMGNAQNTEKHLVIIAKGPDNTSNLTVDELIDKANALNVQVSVIWHIGGNDGFSYDLTAKLPQKTGGISILTPQLSTALFKLPDLLSRTEDFYTASFIISEMEQLQDSIYQGFFVIDYKATDNYDPEGTINIYSNLVYHAD